MLAFTLLFGSFAFGFSDVNFADFAVRAEAAETFTEGYYTYTVDDEGNATITDVDTSISGDVTIPSTLGGYPVISIGKSAFSSCKKITSITIPNSVISIGDYAFDFCDSLISVTIGNGVKTIGKNAFVCEKNYFSDLTIQNFTVDTSNKSYSSDEYGVLFNKDKTELIQYPGGNSRTNYEIPDSVTSIGNYGFARTFYLKSITIPNSIINIGDYSFYKCTLLSDITIPASVTSIGYGAFYDCGLANITVDYANTMYSSDENGVLFNKDKTELIQYPRSNNKTNYEVPNSVKIIGDYGFAYCYRITNVTIPNSVTNIGDYAFYNCTDLTYITLNNGLTNIGDYAFDACRSLTNIIIPNSVTNIGSYTFAYCNSLTNIIIPDNVTNIGKSAFSHCSNLTIVTIGTGVINIGGGAFYSCDNITSVYYPDSFEQWKNNVTVGYSNDKLSDKYILFEYNSQKPYHAGSCGKNLTWKLYFDGELVISGTGEMNSWQSPSSVPWYDYRSEIKTITISDSVTSIGQNAFSDTEFYNDANNWENDVLYIGKYLIKAKETIASSCEIKKGTAVIADAAFYSCNSLTTATIPNSVTSISDYAFNSCKSLTNMVIPDSITTIGEAAFAYCSGLTSLTLGDNLSNIDSGAFNYCDNLTDLTIGKCIENEIISYYIKKISNVTIREGVTSICDEAFSLCSNLANVTLPETLTYIGVYAFEECKKLTSIKIPDNVKQIGHHAFYSCTSLTDISIGNNVTNIGGWAFGNTGYYNDTNNWENDVLYLGKYLIKAKESITGSCEIKEGTEVIANVAFYKCRDLTNVTIPNSVKIIGGSAFGGCIKLENAEIPDSVTTIGEGAFEYCIGFTSVIIPNSVTSIGVGAFSECYGMKYIHIPSSITLSENIGVISDSDKAEFIKNCKKAFEESNYDAIQFLTDAGITESVVESWIPTTVICSDKENCSAKTYAEENGNQFIVCYGKHSAEFPEDHPDFDLPLTNPEDEPTTVPSVTEPTTAKPGETKPSTTNPSTTKPDEVPTTKPTTTEPATKPAVEPTTKPEETTKPAGKPEEESTTNPVIKEEIIKKPSTSTVKYGETLILHADFESIPADAKIEWNVEGKGVTIVPSEDGKTCAVTSTSTGDVTVTAKYTDANGVEHISEQEIKSNASFWQKIVSFFKNLFGINRIIEQRIKF